MTKPIHSKLKKISFFVLGTLSLVAATILLSGHFRPMPSQLQNTSLSDPARKLRAAQITSSFENSTLTLRYDYAEDIGDGNGITAGRAGFTSATGDLLEVVKNYTQAKPQNNVAKYIPILEKANGSKSTVGLESFPSDWKTANKDDALHTVQDQEVDKLYFGPAIKNATEIGIKTALGQEIIWDTWIQHGGGDTGSGAPDGGNQIITETRRAMHGDIHNNEAAWLSQFLKIRLKHLYHMYASTIDDKGSSKSRVSALQSFIDAKKFSLEPPLKWNVYGDSYSLDK